MDKGRTFCSARVDKSHYYLQPLVHISSYMMPYLLTDGSNLSRRAKGVGVGRETAGFDSIRETAVGPRRRATKTPRRLEVTRKLNSVKVGCYELWHL